MGLTPISLSLPLSPPPPLFCVCCKMLPFSGEAQPQPLSGADSIPFKAALAHINQTQENDLFWRPGGKNFSGSPRRNLCSKINDICNFLWLWWSVLMLLPLEVLSLPAWLGGSWFPGARSKDSQLFHFLSWARRCSLSHIVSAYLAPAAAAAKSLQSCPTLCDPIDGSPPGSSIPGILQARTLKWVAISFSP